MGDAVDDERVARWIVTVRRTAFACVVLVASAIVIHVLLDWAANGLVSFDESPPPVFPPFHAWSAACSSAALAWWSAGARRDVAFSAGLSAVAGAVNTPLTFVVLGVVDACVHGEPLRVLGWSFFALLASIFAAPLGAVLGAIAGAALVPLGLGLQRVTDPPTITTKPRALRIAASWCAIGAAIVVPFAEAPTGAREVALVVVVVAVGGVIAASSEVTRRRWIVRGVERGRVPGWTIDVDEHGTRWLVRETRAGDGAYREGVVRVRWGRLDG
ncbi:hypothetical protein [Sandaracinus amylolyticus]|uniref:hypothetical protein n=1 Tax=Sandaracinus amylolyticus TaxID=927083 RepID=UPI001F35AFFE|nr:hypothetical protein [Sandaracinus amylolyticus]UJR85275.1 Hypothetical protein I5071_73550 [Sandaracinus amylolyticus]